MKNEFRELNEREKKILNLMLEKDFCGRDELIKQVASSKVVNVFDNSGSFWGIEFNSISKIIAHVTQRVPVAY